MAISARRRRRYERKLLQAAALGSLKKVRRLLRKGGGRSGSSGSSGDDRVSNDGSEDDSEREEARRRKRKRQKRKREEENIDIDCVDTHYFTPLRHAVEARAADVVAELLAHGADPDAIDDKLGTPLHAAARLKSVELLQLLRDAGGDINAENIDGVTPAHLVAQALQQARAATAAKLGRGPTWEERIAREVGFEDADGGYFAGYGESEEQQQERVPAPFSEDEWRQEIWNGMLRKQQEAKRARPFSAEKKRPKTDNAAAQKILLEEQAKDEARRARLAAKASTAAATAYAASWETFASSCNYGVRVAEVPFPPAAPDELERVVLRGVKEDEKRAAVRREILRWHPDKFMQKFGSRLDRRDHEAVLARVNVTSQMLHGLYTSLAKHRP